MLKFQLGILNLHEKSYEIPFHWKGYGRESIPEALVLCVLVTDEISCTLIYITLSRIQRSIHCSHLNDKGNFKEEESSSEG